ncbi:MAG: PIG-L family deacetylase [Candidatus Nanoarchaeia archaeon]|nr:PIG-L family deacetylase [Candidatus Nanoarchaeia archaeon]
MLFGKKRILVLSPHTDDGELGCGATIYKLLQEGHEVFYAVFSICERSLSPEFPKDTLKKELMQALSVLGVKESNLNLFDYKVREFDTHRQDILEDLIKLRDKIKPDIVLVPSSTDVHQDHTVVYNEAIRAFKFVSILGYELPWNTITFTTNCIIKLNEEAVNAKIEALKKYKSQNYRKYFNESFLRSLFYVRGTQINAEYAEAFEVIRWVIE